MVLSVHKDIKLHMHSWFIFVYLVLYRTKVLSAFTRSYNRLQYSFKVFVFLKFSIFKDDNLWSLAFKPNVTMEAIATKWVSCFTWKLITNRLYLLIDVVFVLTINTWNGRIKKTFFLNFENSIDLKKIERNPNWRLYILSLTLNIFYHLNSRNEMPIRKYLRTLWYSPSCTPSFCNKFFHCLPSNVCTYKHTYYGVDGLRWYT